jgi:hypothetical protein
MKKYPPHCMFPREQVRSEVNESLFSFSGKFLFTLYQGKELSSFVIKPWNSTTTLGLLVLFTNHIGDL